MRVMGVLCWNARVISSHGQMKNLYAYIHQTIWLTGNIKAIVSLNASNYHIHTNWKNRTSCNAIASKCMTSDSEITRMIDWHHNAHQEGVKTIFTSTSVYGHCPLHHWNNMCFRKPTPLRSKAKWHCGALGAASSGAAHMYPPWPSKPAEHALV